MFIPLFLLLTTQQFIIGSALPSWNITFNWVEPAVLIDERKTVEFNLTGTEGGDHKYTLIIESQSPELLLLDYNEIVLNPNEDVHFGKFNITGVFLGKADIVVLVKDNNYTIWEYKVVVKILRPERLMDKMFVISVAVLVSLIYINFGCALNWGELKTMLRKPIGPAIGLTLQFVFMPLASYGLGYLLFPDNTAMRLGMFFTGVSPSGGASNMWTVILGGNLNLSVTMTTISSLAAFALIPFWVFTLGRSIFHSGNIPVPYSQIFTYAIALVVPLFIGYLIQRFLKSVGQFLAKMLKGFASALLIFIIVFAIVANLYLFKLFSWQIVVSGLGLPWLGYFFAWMFAKYVCGQNSKDSLTISIETGIQNTGIAIFLLRFTLPQPEADITTIAPVSVATMTPIPLLVLYVIQRISNRRKSDSLADISQRNGECESYQTITN